MRGNLDRKCVKDAARLHPRSTYAAGVDLTNPMPVTARVRRRTNTCPRLLDPHASLTERSGDGGVRPWSWSRSMRAGTAPARCPCSKVILPLARTGTLPAGAAFCSATRSPPRCP